MENGTTAVGGHWLIPVVPPSIGLCQKLSQRSSLIPAGQRKSRGASFVAVSGPDAGFTVEEISAVVTHGARLVDLGPRSLRSDTAALVMASLLIWLFLALLGMMGVMLFVYRLICDVRYAGRTQQPES